MALVVLGGAGVSTGALVAVETNEMRYAGQLMDRYADQITDAAQEQIDRYGDTLTDLAYSVGAQPDLTSDTFARITAGLSAGRMPGAATVGFVVASTTAQVPAVQRYWRGQGVAGLTLRPAQGRTDHRFLVFDKALDDQDAAGADISASLPALTVLETARHSGRLAASAPYRLFRDQRLPVDQRQMSVTLAAPVYTGPGGTTFSGWMIMGLRGQDLLARAFLDHGQNAVRVSLADPAGTVLTSVAPGSDIGHAELDRTGRITVGQRRWEITMRPSSRLIAATDRGMEWLTTAAGSALTLLLGVMTAVLSGSRNRALEKVDRATAELRRDIQRRERVEAELREHKEQLQHLAFHDPLTGLANRALFYDRLTRALAAHTRDARIFAVMFIDLDGFKEINDECGHHAGDAVLRTTAARLRVGLRQGDTVARFGGDEFAVLLEDLSGPSDARPTAARVIAALREPIDIVGGRRVRVSASVGIAVNDPGGTADDVLRQADLAMYAAKSHGKNRYAEAWQDVAFHSGRSHGTPKAID
ncbi:sensor domain-containing diguanylate cyclase [Catenuloplanes japonicus]|uniref:sensor domain-containing diguanylate cyclase n=1 Tax=Catenuloplanes japonicus TaxID=33876 RepID=UPI000ACB3E58|nr:sensor domain-containing diguanylate cyclase [Catenuloplanes japonicus]